MSQTVLKPELELNTQIEGRWMVKIFNNEHNSFEEVIAILMAATRCSRDEAEMEAWEAHNFGQTPVHFAAKETCERAAQLIGSIGVRTEVCKEWSD